MAFVAGAGSIWMLTRDGSGSTPEPKYLALNLPPGQELTDRYPVISPDGQEVVYVAIAEDNQSGSGGIVPRLHVQRLTEPASRPLPGTEGASAPFFSPDGTSVAYFSMADEKLKRIALHGGGPVVVADLARLTVADLGPGWWTPTGRILLPDAEGPIREVAASGGTPEVLVPRSVLQSGEFGMRFPLALVDDSATLFVPRRPGGGLAAWVGGKRRDLLRDAFQPRFFGADHLLFLRRANEEQLDLCAVAFKRDAIAVAGEPVPVLSIESSVGSSYSMSRNGTLVYKPGSGFRSGHWVWQGLGGRTGPPPPRPLGGFPRVSPDGRHILCYGSAGFMAVDVASGATRILASSDVQRTTNFVTGNLAVWGHDGRRFIYQVGPEAPGGAGLLWKPLDGSAAAERLTRSRVWQQPQMVTADGRYLVYQEAGGVGTSDATVADNYDLWLLPLTPRGEPKPLLRTAANERLPHISPDSRWMAYVSDETGRDQVWVRSFPDGPVAIQVSQESGTEPVWAPDGKTLYYRDASGMRLNAVSVMAGAVPQFGPPAVTIGHWLRGVALGRTYDITPDGTALLMCIPPTYGRELGLVLNFDELIRRKVAAPLK